MQQGLQIDLIQQLFTHYGYIILFPLSILEGPVIMLTAGFLVSLHFFKFSAAVTMIVLGGVVGDILYYFLGLYAFSYIYNFFIKIFGLSSFKIQKLENKIKNNEAKMFILAKISPPLHIPILILAGVVKSPLDYFIYFNLLATLVKSVIIMMIGYYFGKTLVHASRFWDISMAVFLVVSVLLVLAYLKVTKATLVKIKKEEVIK